MELFFQKMKERTYIAIDLKSFYASVECMARGLDPLDTNLVVADESRSDKTICLAVSPSLKRHGIPGRERLYIVRRKVDEANRQRACAIGRMLEGKSSSARELDQNPALAIDFVTAVPQMALYMRISSQIYSIYLKYISPADIHVYSIDEVFMDVTGYLDSYGLSAHDLAMKMILDVLSQTGITATAGIGTNLYLSKVAMDIMAKRIKPDENGVRIAVLDEMEYRRTLWDHEPLTDFWRVGPGYVSRLESLGIRTMGDIALQSVRDEEPLYRLFGVNAELLIDHAWGWEPCTMKDIKDYRPSSSSLSQGQVLMEPYSSDKARLVLGEMADVLALSLMRKRLVSDSVSIAVGYDIENLRTDRAYSGSIKTDFYGRRIPASAGGSLRMKRKTCLASDIRNAALAIYDEKVDPALLVRRLNITCSNLCPDSDAEDCREEQLELFVDYDEVRRKEDEEMALRDKEMRLQQTSLSIKERFGRNALLRLSSYQEGATARERGLQIGGHKA